MDLGIWLLDIAETYWNKAHVYMGEDITPS